MNELQNVILDIFKEVKKICDDNNIKYFAIGGTCIGAVRHKGFIPWDDDLDIAIPIEDYKRFCEIATKKLSSKYEFYTCNKVKHYHYIFNKVINNETTFIENTQIKYQDAYKGVYIDVMPIAGLPSDPKAREKVCKKILLYLKLNVKMRFLKTNGSIKGFLVSGVFRVLRLVLGYGYFSNRLYKLLEKYPLNESEYTGYVWSTKLCKLIFPSKYFKETVPLEFEDTFIDCPKMYHEYLTDHFGDYLQVPPVSERLQHNGIVDLHKSYKLYKKDNMISKKTEECW